jgi:hypothetical protein
MGIRIKPSRNLTASRRIAIKKSGHAHAIGTHPKTGSKMAAINVRCLDGVNVDALKVKKVDGRSL